MNIQSIFIAKALSYSKPNSKFYDNELEVIELLSKLRKDVLMELWPKHSKENCESLKVLGLTPQE